MAQPSPAPAPRHRHRGRRWLLWTLAVLITLLVLLAGLMVAAVKTEWGARTAWQFAQRALPDKLSGELVGGTLADGIRLRNVVYRDATKVVKIDSVEGSWQVSLSPPKLTVANLHLGTVDATLQPSPPEPRTMPQQIVLPLAIDVQQAKIDSVILHQGGTSSHYDDIRLQASSDGTHHRLVLDNADTPYGKAKAALKLEGQSPFSIDGTAGLAARWQDEPYRIDARFAGSLKALDVKVDAAGNKLSGHADIAATPFAPVPFRRAQIDVHHLNPRTFSATAPQADIDLEATLAPVAGSGGPDLSTLAVTGKVSLVNAEPGPLDKERVPLASANAAVTLDAKLQKLEDVVIALNGGGRLEGGGEVRGAGDGKLQGQFALQAQGIDLHALQTTLRSSQLDGPLTVGFEGDTQHIKLALTDPSFDVSADADITPQRIDVKSARLQAGDSALAIDGTLDRGEKAAYKVNGTLKDFNPGVFLATMQPKEKGKGAGKRIDARINAGFSAQGELKPELSAQIEFDVHDSTYEDLPMTGGGNVHVVGTRVLPSAAQLSVAGNAVALKGRFGAPSDRLDVHVDAPALDRLGFGVSGQVQLDGVLGGTLKRPVLDATYRAEKIAFGEQRVDRLSGEAHTQGVPGSDPDARVRLALDATGLRSGENRIDTLKANINGTYADHDIELSAAGTLQGSPLDAKVAAQGRLREQPTGLAWDGVVRTLENRGLPRIAMSAPLKVSVAPGAIELGATRLTVAQANIRLDSLTYNDRVISSAGAFDALDVGRLLELRRQITGAKAPVDVTLVLDGRWDFRLADSGSGFMQVSRKGGDVGFKGPAGETRLGLNALTLRADLRGNDIALDAHVEAERIGRADAKGQIGLRPQNGRLMPAPDAPVSGTVTATIPRLQSIASLAGPRIAVGGNAAVDLRVDGTLAEPRVSGTMDGRELAVTLFDQGVRLRDGSAHLTLDNNVVDLRDVHFAGGDGTLRITGRVPLDKPLDMNASVVADKLQLLASPSGQLTVSGKAQVASVDEQLQVRGKFTVDRALFSLPEKAAPKLGDDVIVIRGGKRQDATARRSALTRASTQPASPFTPRIDVEVDLGDNFRFKGSGADMRLAGAVTIESAPGEAPQARGTVRVVEGTYEAFGAELAIERGVINFQGSPTNPNINILAMRRKQEVAAGVQVTGTVQQPRVQLVSEPNVSEEEKLSWLVFGHGGNSDQQGQAQSAAKGAALGLLNKFGGERVANRFGLDTLSIGSSEFGLANQQVVNLGKELSDRLYVGYEQSLAGAESVLKLTYELTQHWSVILRGGSIAGLDLFYSKRFDTLFGDKKAEVTEPKVNPRR